MALKADFTGSTHIIKIKSGQNDIDIQKDLYSAAKDEWLNEINNLHKYQFPFIVIGGNNIGGGQKAPSYYFLQHPWKIETNGDQVLHNFKINLYAQDQNGNNINPFIILNGDSVYNETSNIPGSELLNLINNDITAILSLIQNQQQGQKDWTNTEKKQIRDALGIDGNKKVARKGQLQKKSEYPYNSTIDISDINNNDINNI